MQCDKKILEMLLTSTFVDQLLDYDLPVTSY